MKQFDKWWNEEQSKELTGEFLIENNLATQEQVLDLLAKTVWRAALEWTENLFVQLNSFEAEETINKELRE